MPTIYTFQTKTPQTLAEGKTLSHFMNQPNDGARVSIQGIGNGIMTSDASASVINSPFAVTTTLAAKLTVPESAIEVTFTTINHTINLSEVNASVLTYWPLVAGTQVTFDCANMQFIYALAATISTLNFFFTIV